jgi:hypothetical protein
MVLCCHRPACAIGRSLATCRSHSLQAAEVLITACIACKRPSTATALYRQLQDAEQGGPRSAALGPEMHALALQALLQEAHRAPAGSSSADAALASALSLLEAHGRALLGLGDAGLLGRLACKAAVLSTPTASSPSLEPYRIVAAARPAASKSGALNAAAAGEQLYAAALPGVQLALWGLRLLQAGGASGADLQSQLAAVVDAAGRAGSGQVLALLQLAQQQLPGLQPGPVQWAALLRYARQDVASRAEEERGMDRAAIGALREACGRLREGLGITWASQLPAPAKV